MKRKRIVLAVCFLILLAAGWGKFIWQHFSEEIQYQKNLKTAERYVEERLYDRAIDIYEKLVSEKDSENLWDHMLEAYRLRSDDPPTDDLAVQYSQDYADALSRKIHKFGGSAENAITLANLYTAHEEYDSAYQCLGYVKECGVKDKEVDRLYLQVKYAYDFAGDSAAEFLPEANGMFAISNGTSWKSLVLDDDEIPFNGEYVYVNQMSAEGVQLITTEKDSRLYNAEGKVLGIFDFKVTSAGMFSEGIIAVRKDDGKYYYYDSYGRELFGGFDAAGAFLNGKAAACRDGEWRIIDSSGSPDRKHVYEDIVLNGAGFYCDRDVILAKKNGKYAMYDSDFKKIGGNFSCDDIDRIAADDLIAFQKGDQWGFVNMEGKVVIKPQYESAKSFSYGLAAVRENGKWGFINSANKLVIDCAFEDADYFCEDGRCYVQTLDPYISEKPLWQFIKLKVGID